MKRQEVVRRIAARQRLCELAFELAPWCAGPVPERTQRLERELRVRAPGLVRLIGERETNAVVHLASRPLGEA